MNADLTDLTDIAAYLEPTYFVDSDHPAIVQFAQQNSGSATDDRSRAIALYYAIRDGFRYNPWGVRPDRASFKASHVLLRDRERGGHCIDKANLLGACARSLGIPSRLHFANVKNHIGTESLQQQLGTDLLVFHGYVELLLAGKWVAATPAFNLALCERLGVAALEFDGEQDSIFQQFDAQGGRFMEYKHDYGSFADIPFELMIGEWQRYYAGFAQAGSWPRKPDDLA